MAINIYLSGENISLTIIQLKQARLRSANMLDTMAWTHGMRGQSKYPLPVEESLVCGPPTKKQVKTSPVWPQPGNSALIFAQRSLRVSVNQSVFHKYELYAKSA